MATSPGATQNGAYDVSADPWAIGAATLANAVLGKETDTTGTSTQTTDNTSAQTANSTSAQNTTGSSALTGATTQAQTGTSQQSTVGTQGTTSSQATTGSTTQAGTQSTGGTVTSNTGGNIASTQTTSQQADTSQLQAVYDKQMGGVTPELLAAIFQQGAKAAPNLVTAQAGALGARGVGNTPMAAVLNQLNADLTSKAALINAQMLGEAGSTAANIANLTKSTSVTGNQAQQSVTQQVQDLITATNNTSTTQQIADAISSTVNQQQQTGATSQNTAGTSTQQQSSQQAVTGTQNSTQAGTQHQVSGLTKDEQVKQTQMLNTNLGGQLAKLAGAGLGITSLYKLAKDSGFLGTVSSFINSLKLSGATTDAINAELAKDGLGALTETSPGVYDAASTAFLGQLDSNSIFNTGYIGNPELSVDNSIDGFLTDETGNYIPQFADGGELQFLQTPNLNETKQVAPQQDANLMALLQSLGVGTAASSFVGDTGTSTGTQPTTPEESSSANGGGSNGTAADGVTDGGLAGNAGNPNGPPANAGMLGTLGGLIGAVAGGPLGGKAGSTLGNMAANAINAQQAAAVAEFNDAAKTTFTKSEHEAFNALSAVSAGGDASDGGLGGGFGMGGLGGFGGGIGDGVGGGFGGGLSGDGGMGDGLGGFGGFGEGWADGGKITGPGTGVSDSILAVGPGNKMIRVANGEYIIPADTTKAVGTEVLDALVEATHVPADLQRAMSGDC